MARLISCATGNLTAAATWALVDATSLLDAETAVQLPQVSAAWSTGAAFTPGAITVDGIALKAVIQLGTTGTVSVRLYNVTAGAAVAGTTVTVNVSDLPSCTQTPNEGGWINFKMAAGVLLLAATSYRVEVQTSSANQMYFWTNGTTDNFSRMLRTTTTQAPVAGDQMFVLGEFTGAGTGNNITVTMDETATTDYGTGTDGVIGMAICKRGSLVYGTTAATNYYFKMSGDIIVYNGGTYTQGSTGTPIPDTSTAVLELDPVADGGMGFIARNGASYSFGGAPRTAAKNVVLCKLNADASAAATTINVDTDTGWKNTDIIVLAKTTRSASNGVESKILNGDAGASSMAITVGLTNARLGTAPRQAHVGLITHNVKVRSATSSIATYINVKSSATGYITWTECRYFGANIATKRGIEIETTAAGSFSMTYSSLYDTRNWGIYTSGATTDNITISNNIFWNLNTLKTNTLYCFQNSSTSGTNCTYTYNAFFSCSVAGSGQAVINYGSLNANFSNNVINDSVSGGALYFNQANASITGTFSDNESYGHQVSAGLTFQAALAGGTITNWKAWNNSSAGILFNASVSDVTFTSPLLFGNQNQNIAFGATAGTNIIFNSAILASTTASATTSNILIPAAASIYNVVFNNSNFGVVTGIYTANTNDVNVTGSSSTDLLFNNCNFGSSTLVASASNLTQTSVIRFHKHNQTDNNHIWYGKNIIGRSTGASLTDTTVRTAGSLGVRLLGSSLTTANSWSFNILAPASSLVNFFGYFQKNAAFGTDVCTVDLYLPGSTTPDATANLTNVTGSWQGVSLSVNNTQTIDGLATVIISCKTTTAAAYIYCDDFFNADTSKAAKLAALDVWEKGKPSTLIAAQAITAADVWTYDMTNLTTANTTGKRLKDVLTVAKYIALD